MKSIIAVAILSVMSSGAMAQGAGISYGEASPGPVLYDTGLTRAQAQNELLGARARGEQIAYGEASPTSASFGGQSLTRAEAHAELMAAIANGDRLTYGEASPQVGFETVESRSPAMAGARRDAEIR